MKVSDKDVVFEGVVDDVHAGLRLDVFLAEVVEDATRSYLKKLILDERVSVNSHMCKRPSRTVSPGETVQCLIPAPPASLPQAENIPLDILYEDEHLLFINKPAGLVVHPAPGHYTGTLVNAILYHCPNMESSGEDAARPGIVHRLDSYTSGVMVVAKTQRAFSHLGKQAHDHAFDRRYLALVRGRFGESHGRIDATIGRSLADRGKMSVTGVRGKHAITHFEVLEDFGVASLVSLMLETGRTHQIRVHMRFAGHPVLGDPLYGECDFSKWNISEDTRTALDSLEGQALHAERLGVLHPVTGERLTFTVPPPPDFQRAVDALRQERG